LAIAVAFAALVGRVGYLQSFAAPQKNVGGRAAAVQSRAAFTPARERFDRNGC
jgi:hypothetical protein